MNKLKTVRGTFGTIYNSMTDECFVELDDVASFLAKNWGNIPKYLGDKKAFEIHLLAKDYLKIVCKIQKLQQQNEKLKEVVKHAQHLTVLPETLQKELAEKARQTLKEIEG